MRLDVNVATNIHLQKIFMPAIAGFFTAKGVMKQSLSRPQRAMLANAIAGRPLEHGVPRPRASGPFSTVQALHRKGMLAGINHLPTAAGRAALAAKT